MESCGPEPTSIWLSENNLTLTGYSIGRFNLIEHAVPNALVSLLNIGGEVVTKIPLSSASGETSISTYQLPEGYYYLMITSARNHFILGKKIMVY